MRAASPESQTADQGSRSYGALDLTLTLTLRRLLLTLTLTQGSRSCGALDALVARVKLQQECSAGHTSA